MIDRLKELRASEIASLVNIMDYLEQQKQFHIDSIVSLNETIEAIKKDLSYIEEED